MSILQENKCPSCGGGLNFDSGLQKLKCPYCDSEFGQRVKRIIFASIIVNLVGQKLLAIQIWQQRTVLIVAIRLLS